MDRIVGHLFRRYALAGVLITVGVVSGVVLAQRQHLDEFPAREAEPVPCLQACEKRGSCGPVDVPRCAALCQTHVAAARDATRDQVRCLLDKPCAELASCGASW